MAVRWGIRHYALVRLIDDVQHSPCSETLVPFGVWLSQPECMGVGLHCVARHCPMPLADLPDSRRQDCRRCLAVGINRIKAMTALRLSKKPRADVADDCPSQGSRIHTRRNLHPFEPPRILQKCHSYFFLSSQSRPRSPPNRNSQYRTYSKSARFRLSPRYRRLRVNDALMWLDAAIIFSGRGDPRIALRQADVVDIASSSRTRNGSR